VSSEKRSRERERKRGGEGGTIIKKQECQVYVRHTQIHELPRFSFSFRPMTERRGLIFIYYHQRMNRLFVLTNSYGFPLNIFLALIGRPFPDCLSNCIPFRQGKAGPPPVPIHILTSFSCPLYFVGAAAACRGSVCVNQKAERRERRLQ
jgi:hypothetical protein